MVHYNVLSHTLLWPILIIYFNFGHIQLRLLILQLWITIQWPKWVLLLPIQLQHNLHIYITVNLATIHKPKGYILHYNLYHNECHYGRRTSLNTTFWSLLDPPPTSWFTANFSASGLPTLEQATYSCPWAKASVLIQSPATFRVWPVTLMHLLLNTSIDSYSILPCDLLMVMAKAGLTGNCLLCQVKGYSPTLGFKPTLGMSTLLPVSATMHTRTLLSRALS